MQDYIDDMHSEMRKLTKDFDMLKEERDKDLEVLHRLLHEPEKSDDIGRGTANSRPTPQGSRGQEQVIAEEIDQDYA